MDTRCFSALGNFRRFKWGRLLRNLSRVIMGRGEGVLRRYRVSFIEPLSMEGLAQKTALVSLSQIPLSEGESEEVGKGGTLQASRNYYFLVFCIHVLFFLLCLADRTAPRHHIRS